VGQEVTNALLADLRSDEGFKPHVYKDHLGFWTLGYGFMVDERKGGRIPKPVAEFWLQYEVNDREGQLKARWPAYERQPDDVKRALLNMSYQLGVDGLLGFTNTLKALERGDRIEAAAHARDSKWHRSDTPARAERTCKLIEGRP
jgi:lysozyme